MSPTVRRLLIIAAILAGVLVLVALALPYLISLDATRARVAAAASAALHREVRIGRMRLQILPGVGARVESVAVLNPPGYTTPALFSADRASVRVSFLPLLSRRVEVRKLVLDGVTLSIERAPDGKSNVDDFLSASKRESAPASRAAAAALFVSRIEIERSRVVFVDRKAAGGEPVSLAIEDFSGRITDIGPSTPARFDLAARFLADAGRNLALRGTLGPPPPEGPLGQAPFEAAFEAKSLALKGLAPYLSARQISDPGALSIHGKAAGKLLGEIGLSGNVALDPSGAASSLPSIDGTFALNIDWSKGTLVVAQSLFDVAALPLSVEGRIDGLPKDPRADLRLATPGDVPIDDVTGFPGVSGRLPENVRLSGRVRLEARIQGPSPDLELRGSISASPFGVAVDRRPFFEASSLEATLASRGQAPPSGNFAVPAGKLQNLPFEGLTADWTWDKVRGVLAATPSARVFGGTLSMSLEADLVPPGAESRVTVEVRDVEAQPLLESATTLRNVFAGSLDGKISIASRGLGWDAISKTATGEGRLSVADADLRTVPLLPEVARSLSAVGKVAGFQIPAALESTKFSALSTSLRLAGGRLSTPDLTLSSRDVSVSADGSLGLDKTLSYQGRVVLGAAIVKSLGSAGRAMADPDGRLSLPFRAAGPVSGPKVSIDETVVLDLGRRALARQVREKLPGAAGALGSQTLDVFEQFLKPPPTPTPKPR